jgi:hypothetical protein
MDGTGDHHVKWDKPSSKRQISHVCGMSVKVRLSGMGGSVGERREKGERRGYGG